MKRKLIKIAYDGTDFNGWQSQKKGRTVQQTLEKVLKEITGIQILINASGRTDAGVHARGQYAHFDFPQEMDNKQILRAFNSGLPPDVRIQDVKDVPKDFHARFAAKKRIYKYFLANSYSPFNRKYRSFLPKYKIYPDRIRKAILIFNGEHNFSSFSKANPDNKSTICRIDEFKFEIIDSDYIFTLSANRFLHNMVRRLVGTTINITSRGLSKQVLKEIMLAEDPAQQMVYTAPPQGLFLWDVIYA